MVKNPDNSMSALYVRITLAYYVESMLGIGQLPTKVKNNRTSTSNDVRLERCVDFGIITLGRHCGLVDNPDNSMSVFYVYLTSG